MTSDNPQAMLIERVARVLCEYEYDGGHLSGAEIIACVEEDMKSSRRKHFEGLARAAIAALSDDGGLRETLPPCIRDDESLQAFAATLSRLAAHPGGNGMITVNNDDAGRLAEAFLAQRAALGQSTAVEGDDV